MNKPLSALFSIFAGVSSLRALLLLPVIAVLAGCATPANHYDPLEPVNRKVYAFNTTLDNAVVKPVAKGYVAVTPKPVQKGVSNFFSNIEDIYIGASDLLEGKFSATGGDIGRVAINSTFGLFGLLDIASSAGLEKHNADFGQVLGKWGVGSGPYIVMPFLGPKTLRDSADWVGEYYLNPLRTGLHDTAARNSLTALKFIDVRAHLLSAENVMGAASFGDEYSFVRDSYLQRRYGLIYDGNPPAPLKLGDDDIGLDQLDLGASSPSAGAGEQKAPAPASTEKPVDLSPPAPVDSQTASPQK